MGDEDLLFAMKEFAERKNRYFIKNIDKNKIKHYKNKINLIFILILKNNSFDKNFDIID